MKEKILMENIKLSTNSTPLEKTQPSSENTEQQIHLKMGRNETKNSFHRIPTLLELVRKQTIY